MSLPCHICVISPEENDQQKALLTSNDHLFMKTVKQFVHDHKDEPILDVPESSGQHEETSQ